MKEDSYFERALELTDAAILSRALIPIKTDKIILPDNNIHKDFELRKLIGDFPKQLSNNKNSNPFEPCDQRLFIDEINNNHFLILNKFPVQLGHMLVITKNYKPQDGWLTQDDFNALISVEKNTNGLWFFNSSKKAGASQKHRHIQLLPRIKKEKRCPRESWLINLINNNEKSNALQRNISVIDRNIKKTNLYQLYLNLAEDIGLGRPNKNEKPSNNYNLLITQEWIAIIKRSKYLYKNFNINALGFAGYFLSTNKSATLSFLEYGGEGILEGVVT